MRAPRVPMLAMATHPAPSSGAARDRKVSLNACAQSSSLPPFPLCPSPQARRCFVRTRGSLRAGKGSDGEKRRFSSRASLFISGEILPSPFPRGEEKCERVELSGSRRRARRSEGSRGDSVARSTWAGRSRRQRRFCTGPRFFSVRAARSCLVVFSGLLRPPAEGVTFVVECL